MVGQYEGQKESFRRDIYVKLPAETNSWGYRLYIKLTLIYLNIVYMLKKNKWGDIKKQLSICNSLQLSW